MADTNTGRYAHLPDLPVLESTEGSQATAFRSALGTVAMLATFPGLLTAFIACFALLARRYLVFAGNGGYLLIGGLVALALVDIWVIIRILWGEHTWVIAPDGITAVSAVRKRFLAWTDVTAVRACQTASGTDKLVISGPNTRIVVTSVPADLAIDASIRQHLRRRGFDLPLSEQALSLWDTFPDALPRDIDWTNPKPPRYRLALVALWSLIGVTAAILALIPWTRGWAGLALLYGGLLLIVAMAAAKAARIAPLQMSLNDDGFRAQTPSGHVQAKWSDVTCTRWSSVSLILRTNACAEVAIPASSNDDSTDKLVLAAIRGIRQAGRCVVTIPHNLRADLAHPPQVDSTSAERRYTRFEAAVLGIPFFVFAGLSATAAFASHHAIPRLQAALISAVLLCLGATAVAIARRYRVRADSVGITRSCIGWQRSITWDQIADCVAKPSARSDSYRRLLLDSSGKLLLEISPAWGYRAEYDIFLAFVRAKLATVLPNGGTKPWHSIPVKHQKTVDNTQ